MCFTLTLSFLIFILVKEGSPFLLHNPRKCPGLEVSRHVFYSSSAALSLCDPGQIIQLLWDSLSSAIVELAKKFVRIFTNDGTENLNELFGQPIIRNGDDSCSLRLSSRQCCGANKLIRVKVLYKL